ncbi:MAG TPA: hypothetical protein VGM56_22065 [Byssovorax sp.]|jgi:hypothetical protein
MFVVALAEARGGIDQEAPALAALLGVAPMEARAYFGAVLPHVVARLSSQVAAGDLAVRLRARGHAVIACDAREVLPTSRFTRAHRMRFEDTAFVPHDGGPARIPYDDIELLVHAVIKSAILRTTHERIVNPKIGKPPTIDVADVVHSEHAAERVLFVFGRTTPPCAIHETEARYLGLGRAMKPTAHANFLETVAVLRERAPGAIYDERFTASPISTADVGFVRDNDTPVVHAGDPAIDLQIHLLASWLRSEHGGSPYRAEPAHDVTRSDRGA